MRAYQVVNYLEGIKDGKSNLDFVKIEGKSIEVIVKEKSFWLDFERYELELALKSLGYEKITITEIWKA